MCLPRQRRASPGRRVRSVGSTGAARRAGGCTGLRIGRSRGGMALARALTGGDARACAFFHRISKCSRIRASTQSPGGCSLFPSHETCRGNETILDRGRFVQSVRLDQTSVCVLGRAG